MRGICSGCGQSYTLRADGTIRGHGRGRDLNYIGCEGSTRLPKEKLVDILEGPEDDGVLEEAMGDQAWSEAKRAYPEALVGFINRDTGCREYVRIDKIIRICECQSPEHKGYALLSLEVGLEVVIVEADQTVEEFVRNLQQVLDA